MMASVNAESATQGALARIAEVISDNFDAVLTANTPIDVELLPPAHIYVVGSEDEMKTFPAHGGCVAFVYPVGPVSVIYTASGGSTTRLERRRLPVAVSILFAEAAGAVDVLRDYKSEATHPIEREVEKASIYAGTLQFILEKFGRDGSYIQDLKFNGSTNLPLGSVGDGRQLSRAVKLQFDVSQRVLIPYQV